jgi:hypothetical protein
MKKSGMTIVFVIVCVGIIVAAYGVGVCIREIRFSRAQAGTEVTSETEKPETKTSAASVAKKPEPPDEDRESQTSPDPNNQRREDGSPRQRMGDPGRATGMFTREQLENMSEEERQQAIAQMRERFGNRRREGAPQLSEEDRAKLREEMESLRERWGQMSDEEKEKVEAEFTEKYGFFPNPDRRRSGGGFGAGRGGRRRGGSDNG